MNVLVYDYLFVKGHIHPNNHYIKLLSDKYNVFVISINGYFNYLSNDENITIIDLKTKYSVDELRNNRILQILFCKKVVRKIKEYEIDYLLLLSYDTISFSIAYPLLHKKNIVLQEHNNIDRLKKRKIELYLYKSFANKTKHIVYEHFMKESLVNEYHISEENIYVLPRAKYAYRIRESKKKYSAIGLSGSNDSSFVEGIVKYSEENNERLRGLRILIKDKKAVSNNSVVEIIKDRVSDDEYEELFNSTRVVLDPLPDSFENRMSAVMFEALSSRKIVIGTNVKIIECFSKKYPHICYSVCNAEEMFEVIKKIESNETSIEKSEFDSFNMDYCDEKTMQVFEKIF